MTVHVGDRIVLLAMGEDPDPIPVGTKGTVTQIIEYPFAQISVDWDIPRSLALLPEVDRFEIIEDDMSYMRSPVYVWVGGWCPDDCPSVKPCPDCTVSENGTWTVCSAENHPDCGPEHEVIHLWPCRGFEDAGVGVLEDPDGYDRDGGINMPMELFDELVVARFFELMEDDILHDVIARVMDPNSAVHGNGGSHAIRKFFGEDPLAELQQRLAATIKNSEEPT